MKKHFVHLSGEERFVIEKLCTQLVGVRDIARVLGRSPNTISRELQKHMKQGVYTAQRATQRAYFKRYRSKRTCLKVAMDSFLIRFVREQLQKKWSPRQMSGYLKRYGITVSAKAIYKFIASRCWEHLLFWSWNRRKRGQKRSAYKTLRDNRKYIECRPVTSGHGHFEMDFIVSSHSPWVLFVLVDMASKQATVMQLPNRKRSTILGALTETFRGKAVQSITTDNDIAFACWKDIEILLNTQVYFTHPYHSWEKGLVENINRWIRCFVAKKRDIQTVTEKELHDIHSFLNDRPREVLGFRSANEVYYKVADVLVEG